MVADKLNFFRFISHFRCVHRGAFFAEMRTTAVRKLLPEAFGECMDEDTYTPHTCGLIVTLTHVEYGREKWVY